MNPKKRSFNNEFSDISREIKNFWKLGWLDNKARYAKTYLGEVWIAISVILLASVLGSVYGDIFGTINDGKVKYFSYLALGITLWNSISDAMAIGSRFILDNAPTILNTTHSLRSIYLRKFFYICQNLIIGMMSILLVIGFVNGELIQNFQNIIFPFIAFLLFILSILIVFSLIGCLIRDFAELVPLLSTILFLSSPILYPAARLGNMEWIAKYNIVYRALDMVRRSVLSSTNIAKSIFIIFIETLFIIIMFWFIERIRYKIALWCD